MSEIADQDVESRARALGWKSPEEWRGSPPDTGLVDAETYLQHNNRLKDDLAATRQEIAEMKETFNEFSQYHRESVANATKAGYEKARQDLLAQQKMAIETQDADAFERAEREKQALDEREREELAAQQQQTKPKTNPADKIRDQWVRDNPWFNQDYQLRNEFKAAGDFVLAQSKQTGETLSPEEYLARSKALVAERFPDHDAFRTDRVPNMDGGTRQVSGPRRGAAKSYSNIPPEDQAVCDRFVRQGLMTQEDYVKEYFRDDE